MSELAILCTLLDMTYILPLVACNYLQPKPTKVWYLSSFLPTILHVEASILPECFMKLLFTMLLINELPDFLTKYAQTPNLEFINLYCL